MLAATLAAAYAVQMLHIFVDVNFKRRNGATMPAWDALGPQSWDDVFNQGRR
jgi:hypothetical protein